jgi:DNA repair protein RecO (recombination protein O)
VIQIEAPAVLLAARAHGETAVVARLLTEDHGLVAGYVAGGRGRNLRPVLIPGNLVSLHLAARSDSQLPFARVELVASRGPYLTEPLPAAAMGWTCALSASVLPERQSYPGLYRALTALLDAVCHAPSARGWLGALLAYETLLLRELGYGGQGERPQGDLPTLLAEMDRLAPRIDHYLLAERRTDVMAARERLRELLGRMEQQ